MIPNLSNGVLHDIINMKEDITEIKQSQREMRGELTALIAVVTNQWRERDREMANLIRLTDQKITAVQHEHSIFKTRVYAIAGTLGVLWTVGTFVATKFL